jgi:hypothetical protein
VVERILTVADRELDPQARALAMVTALVRWGLEGAPLNLPFSAEPACRWRSATELAADYQPRQGRIGLDRTIAELIEDQARWNAGTGFLTGLGGFGLLPLQLPAAVTATWVIQTRMVGAIAQLQGHDLEHQAVRTQILLTLLGDQAAEVLRQVGVKAGQRFVRAQLHRLPLTSLQAINRAVGFQLISRFGERGLLRLDRSIPLVGGVIGGGLDYLITRQLGAFAATELARQAPPNGAARASRSATEFDVIDVELIDERIGLWDDRVVHPPNSQPT